MPTRSLELVGDSVQSDSFSPITDVIDDIRLGRIVILVDDENHENTGDFVVAANFADSAAINFMATFGRGLICLALTKDRVAELSLPPMAQTAGGRFGTAFTVSIEARDGISTGISAADRARTVAVAIDPSKGPDDLVTPGHVFPLSAEDKGVLVRASYTEAAVDLALLAGLAPAGVLCKIINDDGEMPSHADLLELARHHGLKITSIANLIDYRRRTEKLVERIMERELDSRRGGRFRLFVYRNKIDGVEHLALVKGRPEKGGRTYVHVHNMDLLDDILGYQFFDQGGEIFRAMERIEQVSDGVVILVRQAKDIRPSEALTQREAEPPTDNNGIGNFWIGLQILIDLRVGEMTLLAGRTCPMGEFEDGGLRVAGYEEI